MTTDLMEKVSAAVKKFEMPMFSWTYTGEHKQVIDFTDLPTMGWIDELPTIETIPVPVREQTLAEMFVEAARSVIAEAGTDYTYKAQMCTCGCGRGMHLYAANGEGSCLVGRILVRMGISAATLHQYEGASADALVTVLYGRSMEVKKVRDVARNLQTVNDTGQRWGNALPLVNTLA